MASLRLASRRLPNLSSASSRTYATRVTSPSSGLRTAAYATVFTVSAGLFAVYYFDSRAAIHRYFLTPALRNALDAETGHRLAVRCIGAGLGPKDKHEDGSLLKAEVCTRQPCQGQLGVDSNSYGEQNFQILLVLRLALIRTEKRLTVSPLGFSSVLYS